MNQTLVVYYTPRLRKGGVMTQAGQISIASLSSSERDRGLRALAALEQLDQELLQRRGGEPLSPSWKLLDQAREERTGELMRDL